MQWYCTVLYFEQRVCCAVLPCLVALWYNRSIPDGPAIYGYGMSVTTYGAAMQEHGSNLTFYKPCRGGPSAI
jgi:hypothetical protein